MKVFYSQTQRPDGVVYRNPRHFRGVEEGVSQVTVDGPWPVIEAAYRTAGVEVTVINGPPPPPPLPETATPPASLGGVASKDLRHTVPIPENWRDLPWSGRSDVLTLRQVAAAVSDEPVINKEIAVKAIEDELARRSPAATIVGAAGPEIVPPPAEIAGA